MKTKRYDKLLHMAFAVLCLWLAGCADEDTERYPAIAVGGGEQVVFGDYGETQQVAFTASDVHTVEASSPEGWTVEVLFDSSQRLLQITSPASGEEGSVPEGTVTVIGSSSDGVTVEADLPVRIDLTLPPELSCGQTDWLLFEPFAGDAVTLELQSRYAERLFLTERCAGWIEGWQVRFPDTSHAELTPPDLSALLAGEASMGGMVEVVAERSTSSVRDTLRLPVRMEGGLLAAPDATLFETSCIVDLLYGSTEDRYIGELAYRYVRAEDAPEQGLKAIVAYPNDDMSDRTAFRSGVVLDNGGAAGTDGSGYVAPETPAAVSSLYFMATNDTESRFSTIVSTGIEGLEAIRLAGDAGQSPENELSQSLLLSAASRTASVSSRAYGLVRIGGRVWLRENLRATTMSDGRALLLDEVVEGQISQTDAAYAWYGDTQENQSYGALYTRTASQHVCPDGYALPTEQMLSEALRFAGDPAADGAWCAGEWDGAQGADLLGFSALAAGGRMNRTYSGAGSSLMLWTQQGDALSIGYSSFEPLSTDGVEDALFYVRCVRVESADTQQ